MLAVSPAAGQTTSASNGRISSCEALASVALSLAAILLAAGTLRFLSLGAGIPFPKRLGKPEDIAEAVRFLRKHARENNWPVYDFRSGRRAATPFGGIMTRSSQPRTEP